MSVFYKPYPEMLDEPEKFAKDKHSSLFCPTLSDKDKKGFHNIDTRYFAYLEEVNRSLFSKFYISYLQHKENYNGHSVRSAMIHNDGDRFWA